jgi:pimeloyl-ACP methyl ester carboxylesterase
MAVIMQFRLIGVLAVLGISALLWPPAPQGAEAQRDEMRIGVSLDALPRHHLEIDNFRLHYADTGGTGMPVVVLLHGTPGSWRSLGRVMESADLQQRARLVSIDRPGWGASALPGKSTEPDFAAQAALMVPLLRQLKEESGAAALVLAGHSYGGSMAAWIAFKHPELVDSLLIASGAIDPVLGKPRWYNYAANIWPVSRLLDTRLLKANAEIWGVSPALEELESWWANAQIPIIFVQGEKDRLVSPGNLDFAEQRLPAPWSKIIRLPEQGHLLHVQQRPLLVALILELLQA